MKLLNMLDLLGIHKERVAVVATKNFDSAFEVDLHGLTVAEAKRFMNNIINCIAKIYHNAMLRIIHGFNHGTAIRDMLNTQFENSHIQSRKIDEKNPGVTTMTIAGIYA